MIWCALLVGGLVSLAGACEPAIPLIRAMSGSLISAGSIIGVVVTVLFKCGVFALMVPRGRRGEGAGLMLVANQVSGVMGLVLVAILAAPFLPLLLLVPLASWLPARRLGDIGVITRFGPLPLVVMITLLFAFNAVAWGFSQTIIEADHASRWYWLVKFAWLVPALSIALLTGTMWEEWTISALGKSFFADDRVQLAAVFRANAWAMLMAMAFAALVALPRRLNDPKFLLYGL